MQRHGIVTRSMDVMRHGIEERGTVRDENRDEKARHCEGHEVNCWSLDQLRFGDEVIWAEMKQFGPDAPRIDKIS